MSEAFPIVLKREEQPAPTKKDILKKTVQLAVAVTANYVQIIESRPDRKKREKIRRAKRVEEVLKDAFDEDEDAWMDDWMTDPSDNNLSSDEDSISIYAPPSDKPSRPSSPFLSSDIDADLSKMAQTSASDLVSFIEGGNDDFIGALLEESPQQQAGDTSKRSPDARDPLALENDPSDSESDDDDDAPRRVEDLPNVVVQMADTAVNPKNPGQKISRKKHFCRYCGEAMEQIIRHVEARHSTEDDVKDLLNADKKSRERARLTTLMKNRGNFEHNIEVLRRKEGTLIVVRSPSVAVSAGYYYPCTQCYGFFSKNDVWRHHCVSDVKVTAKQCRTLLSTALNKESPILNTILQKMKNDEVTQLIKHDPLIRRFLNQQLDKYEVEAAPQKIALVRNRARDIGRLLHHIQKNNSDLKMCDLQELIVPERFDIVVRSVFELANQSENPAASLPIKLGQTIEKICGILNGMGIRSGDNELLDRVERFSKLFKEEWSPRVSLKSRRQLYNAKLNKPSDVPKTEDVVKMANSLSEEAEKRMTKWIKEPGLESGRKLAEAVLSQLIVFNKRRGGEASRMMVKNYRDSVKNFEETDFSGEIFCSLKPEEQFMARTHILIWVIGKCGTHVPVILTLQMKQKIDALLENRLKTLIPHDNPYVFGVPRCQTHLKSWDVLRHFCQEFQTNRITSTGLRKYLATTAQVMDLSDQEIGWLSKHLGHTVAVHRRHYRQHTGTIEVGKITKILHSSQQGTLHTQRGKNFDTMDVPFTPETITAGTQELLTAAAEDRAIQSDDSNDEDTPEAIEEPVASASPRHRPAIRARPARPANRASEEPVASTSRASEEPVASSSRASEEPVAPDSTTRRGAKRSKKEKAEKPVAKRRKVSYDAEISKEEREKIRLVFDDFIANKRVPKKEEILHYIDSEGSSLDWKQVKGVISSAVSSIKYKESKSAEAAKETAAKETAAKETAAKE